MAFGCARTAIQPAVQSHKENRSTYVAEGHCEVRDFESANELPAGSKNLGWVAAESTGNDEETIRLLRKKICDLNGDALSGMAWVPAREGDKLELRANAWALP